MDTRIDFICQHTMDGNIIPLKIRLRDEDGELQEYAIKGYRDTSKYAVKSFDVKIIVLDTIKYIHIFCGADEIWRLKI